MDFTINDFNEVAAQLLIETRELAKKLKSTKIDEYHFATKIWKHYKPQITKWILDDDKYAELAQFWYESSNTGTEKVEESNLSNTILNILDQAHDIAEELEVKKIQPAHILYGMIKLDGSIKDKLKEYDITPTDILKLCD